MSLEYQEHYTHSRRGDLEAQAEVEEAREGVRMKPRKPDRFERMVLKKTYPDMAVYKEDAINLLRKEHAWMRRQLSAIAKIKFEEGPFHAGVAVAIEEMLYRLEQRRK